MMVLLTFFCMVSMVLVLWEGDAIMEMDVEFKDKLCYMATGK